MLKETLSLCDCDEDLVFRNIPASLPAGPAPVNGNVAPPAPVSSVISGPPRLVKIIFLSSQGSVLATSRVLRDRREGDMAGGVITRKVGSS